MENIEKLSLPMTKEKKLSYLVMAFFITYHMAALLVFHVGFSWVAFLTFFAFYVFKASSITIGFHRYFAHRSFKTSRFFQFLLGLAGSLSGQGGVLWWSSHHRAHHKHSDEKEDLHSPVVYGFWESHMGWMMNPKCFKPAKYKLNDFTKFPEIKFLNKFYGPIMILQGVLIYFAGVYLENNYPELGTSGLQLLVWGFFLATVWTWHVTFSINSICHIFGKKRFKSNDESRNNWIMGILAMGEGWHNNHHKYGWSARNGMRWYEFDLSWYVIKTLSLLGIVWDVKVPTKEQLKAEI